MRIVLKNGLLTAGCLILSCSVFAYPSSRKHAQGTYHRETPSFSENPDHFEGIAGLGLSSIHVGNSNLGVTSNEVDELVQTNYNSWNTWLGQIGAGYVSYFPGKLRFSPDTQWFTSIEPELNLYYSANQVKGGVYRFNNPNFNDLSYKSTIRTTRLMLDAAMTIVSRDVYSLFVIGGIGDSWSKISYHDAQNGSAPCNLTGLGSSDSKRSNIVWELGAGVAYAFNDRVNLSLEYLFTDYGSLKFPRLIQNTTLTTPLITQSNFSLNTQAVLLGLHVGLS